MLLLHVHGNDIYSGGYAIIRPPFSPQNKMQ